MRSRAHVKAHPIHPAVIPFPFAFLWGAAIFDVLHLLSGREDFTITASHLTVAGLIAGVVAAIPGAIDYFYAVPPQSSAKQRATKHALGNTTALVLFLVAWITRGPDGTMVPATLVFEVLGAAIMAWAGLLGGELVVRNMISVDHRYADKGKWKEASVEGKPGEEVTVSTADELQDGHMKLLWVNGSESPSRKPQMAIAPSRTAAPTAAPHSPEEYSSAIPFTACGMAPSSTCGRDRSSAARRKRRSRCFRRT